MIETPFSLFFFALRVLLAQISGSVVIMPVTVIFLSIARLRTSVSLLTQD